MKTKSFLTLFNNTTLATACLGLAWLGTMSSASAALRYWDPNGNTSGTGGDGTWDDGTTANWSASSTGGTPINWSNAALDQAFFGGTPGNVTVSGTVETRLLTTAVAAMNLVTITAGTYNLSGG